MNHTAFPDGYDALLAPRRWRLRTWLSFGGLILLTLTVGWYLFLTHLGNQRLSEALAAADRDDPGWRMDDIEARRAVLPDDRNAALVVLRARQLMPRSFPSWMTALNPSDPAERKRMALEESFNELGPSVLLNADQLQVLRDDLKQAGPAFAEALKLLDLPQGRYVITWKPDYISTLIPHVQHARELIYLPWQDMMLCAHEQDWAGAFRSCRIALNVGRSLGDEPVAISQLVRIACREGTLRKLERVLAQGEPPSALLAQTQQAFAEEAEEPLQLYALRGERASMDGLLQNIQEGQVSMSSLRLLAGTGGGSMFQDVGFALLAGSIRNNRAAMLHFMNEAIENAKRPAHEQWPHLDAMQARAMKLPIVAKLLCPAIGKVAEACIRNQATMHCTTVALAAERYRRDNGRWPATLEELVPTYLDRVPLDPFDGKPLRLGRFAEGIVIYSVGVDQVDNGGNLDLKNPQAKGSDLGFRLWDVKLRRQPARPLELPPGPEDEKG